MATDKSEPPTPREAGAAGQGKTTTLRVEKAQLWSGKTSLFQDLSFTVRAGEVVSVMAPSGAGKSALLHWLCGTLPAGLRGAGKIFVNDTALHDLPAERRGLGILFQDDLLFPHMTVRENLLFGLDGGSNRSKQTRSRSERGRRMEEALVRAELQGYENRLPRALSGGQRMRVALFRTLLSAPQALLLDEPFSALDVALRVRMRAFVFSHARQEGLPVLLASHDPADAPDGQGSAVGDKDKALPSNPNFNPNSNAHFNLHSNLHSNSHFNSHSNAQSDSQIQPAPESHGGNPATEKKIIALADYAPEPTKSHAP